MLYGEMKSWELASDDNITDLCWDKETFVDAHKFFMGRREDYDPNFIDLAGRFMVEQALIRLPFSHCLFEYLPNTGEPYERFSLLCEQQSSEEKVVINVWLACKIDGRPYQPISKRPVITPPPVGWYFIDSPVKIILYPETKTVTYLLPEGSQADVELEAALIFARELCIVSVGIISSTSFIQKEVVIPTKLQKAREKSGKLPFYEFKVVELRPEYKIRNPPIGTHASPKLHWRRGHYRWVPTKKQYAPIPPMLVGRPEYGAVEKEYDTRGLSK